MVGCTHSPSLRTVPLLQKHPLLQVELRQFLNPLRSSQVTLRPHISYSIPSGHSISVNHSNVSLYSKITEQI